jgi:amino acid transporter
MVATAFIGSVGAIITAFTTIAQVIRFAAFLLVVLYGVATLSALVSCFRQRDLERPYWMSLCPLPPLLTLLGCIVVTGQQSLTDIAIVGAILLLGALYYALYLWPRAATHWVMLKPVAADQNENRTAEPLPLNNPGL